MGYPGKVKEHLRENWGTPFVAAAMALFAVSLAQQSFGSAVAAGRTASYAAYSLVLGTALQIASYVKDGPVEEGYAPEAVEPTTNLPWAKWSTKRKSIAILVVAVVIVSVTTGAYFGPQVVESRLTPAPRLGASISYATIVNEPGGTEGYLFGVNALGGREPYHYVATWSDGTVQSSSDGTFSRTMTNQTLLTYANVTVSSSDGQAVKLVANFTQG